MKVTIEITELVSVDDVIKEMSLVETKEIENRLIMALKEALNSTEGIK